MKLTELLTHNPLGNGLDTVATLASWALVAALCIWLVGRIQSRLDDKHDHQDISHTGQIRLYGKQTRQHLGFSALRASIVLACALGAFTSIFHDAKQASLIGASLMLALTGWILGPVLKDIIAGFTMMSEKWYQVGDLVTIHPQNLQGVVERIGLRTTTLQGLNGERTRVHHGPIEAVRIAPLGVRRLALEIYTHKPEQAGILLEELAEILPTGPTTLVDGLSAVETKQVSPDIHRLRVEGLVVPGREWFLEDYATGLLEQMDDQEIIMHEPLVYNLSERAERRYARATASAKN